MVKTLDIYQGAYILTKGGALDHLELSEIRGRRAVTFVFAGVGVDELSREFVSGQAMANVSVFRGSLDHLKDMMFAALRNRENEKEKERQPHERKRRTG